MLRGAVQFLVDLRGQIWTYVEFLSVSTLVDLGTTIVAIPAILQQWRATCQLLGDQE